jgi:hypothetical protein
MKHFQKYYNDLKNNQPEDYKEITEDYLNELRIMSIIDGIEVEELTAEVMQMVVTSALHKLIQAKKIKDGYDIDIDTAHIYYQIADDPSYYMDYNNFNELSEQMSELFEANLESYKIDPDEGDFQVHGIPFYVTIPEDLLTILPEICPN